MGEVSGRIELTGLKGVPETVLSEALVAGLPANQSGAPWECHCSALLWLGRGGSAAAAALPPALAGSPALATVGGFVRYTDTPVGPYDEVLGVVVSRTGLRPWGHVAFMSVDSPTSLVGGRTNWAMPKTLARFDGEPGPGVTMTGTGTDQLPWSVSATARVVGPALPIKGRGTARQQFPDGRIGDSVLSLSGRVRPAMMTLEVTSEGTLPTWLRPGRHLGALLEKATVTLGRPRFE
jgi:Acetoacetate decarboxylase (ADC)